MTAYDYIRDIITEEKLNDMVRLGIVSVTTSTYYEIFDWAKKNKKNRREVSEHFRLPSSTISYAYTRMRATI